ncbi:hypothetical protein [Taklimakanibacter albus]|uniref:Uncharacterized protein n=1 Tax=Taklimakanibacter albus TaxID=2800327 RepID=A0ACC5QY53_9HYPH|nr:hypothetical protein [Aestuariivirga sp. YIM B02566]MBK1865292.1 hypothetical protein [Aestuariivirga sp. YIM B02566]
MRRSWKRCASGSRLRRTFVGWFGLYDRRDGTGDRLARAMWGIGYASWSGPG